MNTVFQPVTERQTVARIAFILLCHKDPKGVIAQAQRLTAAGDYVAIHYDARSDGAQYRQIQAGIKDNDNILLLEKRIKCGWGDWSLVAATLAATRAALDTWPEATHCYLISGDCMPIKPAETVHRLLDEHDVDRIEAVDFFASDWIRTGMKGDRLHYRHWFNERSQSWWFYKSYELQKALGLKRDVPRDIKIHIGSQWWCLRRKTLEAIFDFIKSRPDVTRFFATTWVPDETFLQTLTRHLVPKQEIESRTPTFLIFSDYGMPVVFYNDQTDLLLAQSHLFARKVSPDAKALGARLDAIWMDDEFEVATSNGGKALHTFLTGQGRVGRRYAQRVWEADTRLGPDRRLLMVSCKKWHLAKRLLARSAESFGLKGVHYAFHEVDAGLPNLGGIEKTLEKRERHRRLLLRLLYDHFDTNTLALCVDPSSMDLMQDFYADGADTRLLHLECEFSDDEVAEHACRIGLSDPNSPPDVVSQLTATLRAEMAHEVERIRDADFPKAVRLSRNQDEVAITSGLASFFDISEDQARALGDKTHLFAD